MCVCGGGGGEHKYSKRYKGMEIVEEAMDIKVWR